MLYKETTTPFLFEILAQLMSMPLLAGFRLVGGTALSLQRGHRISDDIDLFTDNKYGSTDFRAIEEEIKARFLYTENTADAFPAVKAPENNMGLHLFIGYNEDQVIKTDILYWDPPFILKHWKRKV